ncbi:hypothetical protein AFCA_004823 [Aspergillus flavus]|nr:hypothetical protein AFCA_004823 [Aspergillus flavus]
MRFQSLAAAILLSLSITIHATQTFKNTGTTSGWSSINQEHKGTVQQVTNVVYGGSTALKMTQVYDSSYSGRYHSEVVHNDMYKLGDEGFYGFTFRLQESWQFSPAQSYNIAQFIADFGDTGCDDYMPSSMVWLIGDQLFTRVKTGSVCAQKTTTFSNLATGTIRCGLMGRRCLRSTISILLLMMVGLSSSGLGFMRMAGMMMVV